MSASQDLTYATGGVFFVPHPADPRRLRAGLWWTPADKPIKVSTRAFFVDTIVRWACSDTRPQHRHLPHRRRLGWREWVIMPCWYTGMIGGYEGTGTAAHWSFEKHWK
jgi:hypothetical protein